MQAFSAKVSSPHGMLTRSPHAGFRPCRSPMVLPTSRVPLITVQGVLSQIELGLDVNREVSKRQFRPYGRGLKTEPYES